MFIATPNATITPRCLIFSILELYRMLEPGPLVLLDAVPIGHAHVRYSVHRIASYVLLSYVAHAMSLVWCTSCDQSMLTKIPTSRSAHRKHREIKAGGCLRVALLLISKVLLSKQTSDLQRAVQYNSHDKIINAQGSHRVCFVVRTGDAHYAVAP